MMTPQPGGASAAMNNRQQATEADTYDEQRKSARPTGVTSDHSPFSPRRSMPKSLDRNSRRAYISSPAAPAQTSTFTDQDVSLSRKQQQQSRGPLATTQGENQKESWKTAVFADLSQRGRRSTPPKSTIAGDPLAANGKGAGKEDSPASASQSDSAKARNGTAVASSVQNRSYQLRTSDQPMQMESSPAINADDTPSPAVIMYTSAGSIEHGKPPKTPRSTRANTSRSDAVAPARQMPSRAGDSEAMSMPAATYAIKVGPQTIMSQWIVSLNDNLDDEGSDNQHSAKWEDAQEKLQRWEITRDEASG